jgi:hypothetical protein
VADLPPNEIDADSWTLTTTLDLPRAATTVRVSPGRKGFARVDGSGPSAGVRDAVRHLLRLDADLSAFYAVARADDALVWAASGAGYDAQPDRLRRRRQDDLHDELRLVWDGADDDGARRAPRRGGA